MIYSNVAGVLFANLGPLKFAKPKSDTEKIQSKHSYKNCTTNIWFFGGKIKKVKMAKANLTKNKNCKRCEFEKVLGLKNLFEKLKRV